MICVGSTGAGKSSTISKCTRRPVSSGSGKDRVTVRCDSYVARTEDQTANELVKYDKVNKLVWVDTVGWDDADLEDDSTFKDILGFINDAKLLRVKAIVWSILPNCRKDALLMKQAKMIDLFRPGDIWNNVIIICKQSRNPEEDVQGALAAARHFNSKAEPKVLGFTYLDDPTLTSKQRRSFGSASTREIFLIKNDDEVRSEIFDSLLSLGKPIKGKMVNLSILRMSYLAQVTHICCYEASR